MKLIGTISKCVIAGLVLGLLGGCSSTDGGGSVSGSAYYGVGYYDPWYYGGYYNDPDIIVTPPPAQPGAPVKPMHPIATPPPAAPRPMPMPSIPAMPRPPMRR